MPRRHLRLAAPPDLVHRALEELREEAGIPVAPPAAVADEARDAAERLAAVIEHAAGGDLAAADAVPSGIERPRLTDARDVPLVTIDPPQSTDLDQAVHLERRAGGGWRIDYAIASLAEVVTPGGALDADVHARAVTVYGPTGSFPLHPPEISSGICSLLPQRDAIALLWSIELDASGAIAGTDLRRALVRSRAKLGYSRVQAAADGHATLPDDAPATLPGVLREVGEIRAAREIARGGASLNLPEQEVVQERGGFRLRLRSGLPAEAWNAQISLTTGIAAARLMAEHGVGVLRTLPDADPRDVRRLRRTAAALGIPWAPQESYGQVLARMDAAQPTHVAFLDQATTLFRGSGYRVLTGPLPPETADAAGAGAAVGDEWRHAAIAARYAHVTAPLRRLVDRYGLEACLAQRAGTAVPGWVLDGLATVSADMAAGTRRAGFYERGAVDAVEALLLADRVGEVVDAVVVDVEQPRRTSGRATDDAPDRATGAAADPSGARPVLRGSAVVTEPAVQCRIEGPGLIEGSRIPARVAQVDVAARRVVLAPAAG